MSKAFKIVVYSPAGLFAEKRRLQDAEKKSKEGGDQGLAKIMLGGTEKEEELTGDALLLDNAEKYLKAAMEIMTKHYMKFDELLKLGTAALNIAIDDNDRKKLYKKFSQLRDEMDALALNPVEGDRLFAGDFAQEGKELIFSEEGQSIVLRCDGLTAKALKMERTKIDSLVNARKAVQELESAKKSLEQQVVSVRTKLDPINFFKKRLEEQKAAKAGSKDKSKDKSGGESAEGLELPEFRKAFYADLLRKQQNLARYTGSEIALLLQIFG